SRPGFPRAAWPNWQKRAIQDRLVAGSTPAATIVTSPVTLMLVELLFVVIILGFWRHSSCRSLAMHRTTCVAREFVTDQLCTGRSGGGPCVQTIPIEMPDVAKIRAPMAPAAFLYCRFHITASDAARLRLVVSIRAPRQATAELTPCGLLDLVRPPTQAVISDSAASTAGLDLTRPIEPDVERPIWNGGDRGMEDQQRGERHVNFLRQ